MKKLLILATAVVAGVAANAASFKWTAANIYAADGTTKYAGTVNIYAYENGGDIASAVIAATTTISGGSLSYTTDWADAIVDKKYDFFFVYEDGGKRFNSAESTPAVIKSGVAQATSTISVSFANMASATQNASNWAAVPEPTSGLLMLLGLAGLALKRKRA